MIEGGIAELLPPLRTRPGALATRLQERRRGRKLRGRGPRGEARAGREAQRCGQAEQLHGRPLHAAGSPATARAVAVDRLLASYAAAISTTLPSSWLCAPSSTESNH